MEDNTAAAAAAAASSALASKVSYAGSATAVASGFLADNWLGLAGLLIAFCTMLINWYYKHAEFNRNAEKDDA